MGWWVILRLFSSHGLTKTQAPKLCVGSMRNPGRSVPKASQWVWIWILRNPCDLCFGKSRVNSGYLWVRLHVRACLAIFTNCWRPHSVSWSRPERQHPWEKERECQIYLFPSNTQALKHIVISAEKHYFSCWQVFQRRSSLWSVIIECKCLKRHFKKSESRDTIYF